MNLSWGDRIIRGRMKFYNLLLVVVMAGCATTSNPDQVFSAWIDKPLDDLIFKVGQPDSSYTQNDGSKVYEFVRTKEVRQKNWGNTFDNLGDLSRASVDPNYVQGEKLPEYKIVEQTCTVRFKVNSLNIIKSYAYSGYC